MTNMQKAAITHGKEESFYFFEILSKILQPLMQRSTLVLTNVIEEYGVTVGLFELF